MQDILSISCGLDVHKETVVACIIKSLPKTILDVNQQNTTTTEIRVFSTLLDDLNRLRQWIESENCKHIAMESTGVYWCPVYDVLETAHKGEIELLVTNARHMKNVPGKKSDMNDAEWIASLLRAGLLRGSFIPETGIRELRQLTRYRKTIVQDIGKQKNRIEKQLQQCGFKMSTFLTDIFGVSGRNLLNILADTGRITPLQVEKALRARAKLKKDEMKLALNGNMNQHQRDFLRLQLSLLDELTKHLSNVENDIQKSSANYSAQIQLLTTIPGIALTAATAIISEIGMDMSKFPTAEHFSSWVGLSPGENESAGKKKAPESILAIPI